MNVIQALQSLEQEASQVLLAATNEAQLFAAEKLFLGRKGKLSVLMGLLSQLQGEEKSEAGKVANQVKHALQKVLTAQKTAFENANTVAVSPFELEFSGTTQKLGSRHPLMLMQEKIEDIFLAMGYEILYGPEIELAKYNFDLLRIPENHPARDVWDTFYVEGGPTSGPNTPLLRTHISPMQIRVMEERTAPIRFISPGRIFRHEATDATHEANYYYCEGLAIEKGLTMGDLFGTLEQFFHALFGKDVALKFQPSFYPFVEPGAELLMKGKKGWLEMLGCGMVHPEVLKNMGVDPKEYSGFAFGMGIDRLMLYYNDIHDVRASYQGDIRFLEQF